MSLKYIEQTRFTFKDLAAFLLSVRLFHCHHSGLDIKGEMIRYRAGLACVPIAGFMVMYNKHTLSLEDLGTLEEQNWLNDQVKTVQRASQLCRSLLTIKVPLTVQSANKKVIFLINLNMQSGLCI